MLDAFELYHSADKNSITAIIGENGTGKSSLLAKISRIASSRHMTIPIATSIYDKFSARSSKKLRPLKASAGSKIANQALMRSFKHIQTLNSNDNINRLRWLGKILAYVGYDPTIGIRITLPKDNHNRAVDVPQETFTPFLDEEEHDAIYSLEKWKTHANIDGIAWIDIDTISYKNIEITPIIQLASHLDFLKKFNKIRGIEFFLSRHNEHIPLLHASSGELTFVITMLHIGSHIEPNTILIIDEPESSLHPKWQRQYITQILDLFYLYEPIIFIATHSPLIIASKELANCNFRLIRSTKSGLTNTHPKHVGIESLLWEDFDVLTPKSYYLSTCIQEIVHQTLNNEMSKETALKLLDRFKNSAYDDFQTSMINNYTDFIASI